jgi:hypothetical protein
MMRSVQDSREYHWISHLNLLFVEAKAVKDVELISGLLKQVHVGQLRGSATTSRAIRDMPACVERLYVLIVTRIAEKDDPVTTFATSSEDEARVLEIEGVEDF